MKKLLVAIALFVTVATTASAGWFIQPQMFVTPFRIDARIINIWHRPIICEGYLTARTHFGVQLDSWVRHLVLYPGAFHNAYVYSRPGDPLMHFHTNITCDWWW